MAAPTSDYCGRMPAAHEPRALEIKKMNIKQIVIPVSFLLILLVSCLVYDATHPIFSDVETQGYSITFKYDKNISKVNHAILLPAEIKSFKDFAIAKAALEKYGFQSPEWIEIEDNIYNFNLPVRRYSYRFLPFKKVENYCATFFVAFEDVKDVWGSCELRTEKGKYNYLIRDIKILQLPASGNCLVATPEP